MTCGGQLLPILLESHYSLEIPSGLDQRSPLDTGNGSVVLAGGEVYGKVGSDI